MLVARAVELDGRISIATVQTDQNIVDRSGPSRRCQVAPGSEAPDAATDTTTTSCVLVLEPTVRVLVLVLVAAKVATGSAVLVQMVVAADVVRIECRLVVLRVVGMRWRNQRRLDQGHILVQQTVIIIVHTHCPHCNDGE